MAIKTRIWWDPKVGSYIVSSVGYSAQLQKLVDALKQFIPSGSRDYDPASKFWYIKEQYGDFIRQAAESAFGVGSVSFVSKTVAEQQQSYSQTPQLRQQTPTQQAMSDFVELLPYEAAKKAYLLACQQLHPDKPTGDAQKMARLNEVWERLEKEVYRR